MFIFLRQEVTRKRAYTCTLLAVAACMAIAALPLHSAGEVVVSISGRVIGVTGKHAIYVALWDSHGFLRRPVQQVRVEPQAAPSFQFQAPVGRWAISAFEDTNDNGVLDLGLFGPKEPSGFSRAFHGWRKPHFDDVAVEIDRDTTVTITLNR